jgi:oligopeptide transport system substrate-binding protein
MALLALFQCACERSPPPAASRPPAATVLHRGLGAEPETLDPRLASDNAALAILGDLYEGLTAETADGRIGPGAAESWSVSPDGLTWTFHLRPHLRWSNGDPLTADDFAAALASVIAPDSQAPNAGLLEAVARIAPAGPDALRIDLKRPLPYLPALLALPVGAPRHRASSDQASPATNGPYRLVEWRHGERIELERNPDYHAAGAVSIDRVVYSLVTDLATELNLYRTGALDLTSEVPNAQLGWIRANLPDELEIAPFLSTYAYAVNLSRLPDPRARQALAMSIDRARITGQVTGAGERPAYGWVPDGIPGYTPARFDWHNLPYSTLTERARAMWRDARSRNAAPDRITLCTDASANHRRTAVAIADLWRSALGLETAIVELEWNVYLDTRRHPGECDLVRLGWSADFVDAEAFADVFESGHPQNTLGYRSLRYDELLRRSRMTADASTRAALLADAEAQLLADAPVVPIFFRVSKRLVKPYVEGYHASPLGHVATRDLRVRSH